ncbi:cyclopentanone monooxygenase [Colletotrichum truncatum]|uniref:Cyclopentanone monooxygenase n=1 Tax=Colletotrichum truncatum TaxID=5467 RepID=A0ACC3YPD0_COLTU
MRFDEQALHASFPQSGHVRGPVIHPSAWPSNIQLTGKKIGIIGQVASGLQIVQELAKTANACLYDFWVSKTRIRMTDPEKRDIVAPLDQFEWVGASRVNLEIDYYEMLDRPNVSCRGDAIHHDLDIIIMATGYDSVTGSLLDMNIRNKHGVRLQDAWQHGISTYLGMMAPNMPNAFVLYGPQGPTTQTNAPPLY